MLSELRKVSGLNIEDNVSLSNFTTFKIGGPAKYFVKMKNRGELFQALAAVKKLDVNFFVMGAGSNLLVSDTGFDGLVIRLEEG